MTNLIKSSKNSIPPPIDAGKDQLLRQQSRMSYITVKAIESDTSYLQFQWPTFTLKELMDNAWDFLNDYYPGNPKEDRKIAVTIKVELKPDGEKNILRITVRNSNVDNIPVFEVLDSVFDYDQWYSTK
ncbi:MAG: hypothetical protein WA323_10455, partial [Candidatus Nitrosopolaris sp.]